MPSETERVGQFLLAKDSAYRLVGEKLFETLSEQEFADLYPSEGQPGLSPVILALVTVFQFIEKLPDRQAAEMLRMRLDWKYALHLPLEYEGFNFSVFERISRSVAGGQSGRKSV